MKESILITGIAGFVGSALARKLCELNYIVIGIDDLSSGDAKSIPKESIFFKCDLSKKIPKSLESKKYKIDYIFHLAGQSSGEISFENPIDDLEKNTISTIRILDFGKRKKIKKLFYASSMSVYGDAGYANENLNTNPKTCYGISKLASEHYIKIYNEGLSYLIFRIFNVYGPSQKLNNLKQGMIRIYMTQLIKTNKILVKGSPDRYRDFIYIDDLINLFIKFIKKKNIRNSTFNLGTGKKIYVREVIKELKNLNRKKNTKIKYLKNTKGDQKGIYANINKLKYIFPNLKFTKFRMGLNKYFNQVKK